MGRRKNDGYGKFGGRKKGTPNKVTGTLKEWINELITSNQRQIKQDLKEIEPYQRLQMLEKLMQYVLPKQNNTTAEIDINKLSDEQVEAILNEIKDIE